MLRKSIMTLIAGVMALAASAQNPKLHIYLCIGQSNMEGNAQIEQMDRTDVPERFRMMAAVDFSNPQRTKGEWYTAVPPLVRQGTGLTPADWFGRTMLDNMAADEELGVVMVAVGGCKIEHLAKDYDPSTVVNEADWFRSYMAQYDNKPYDCLIECAKKAQRDGVIKGILLHQGCSNNGDQQWPAKVKKIYEDILKDLSLNAADVPLIAGELARTEMGGVCGGMNTVINRLPETVPTAHVVSSKNLEQKGDGLHFTPHAYRVLGTRYATEMLSIMGVKDPVINYKDEKPEEPELPAGVLVDKTGNEVALNGWATTNGSFSATAEQCKDMKVGDIITVYAKQDPSSSNTYPGFTAFANTDGWPALSGSYSVAKIDDYRAFNIGITSFDIDNIKKGGIFFNGDGVVFQKMTWTADESGKDFSDALWLGSTKLNWTDTSINIRKEVFANAKAGQWFEIVLTQFLTTDPDPDGNILCGGWGGIMVSNWEKSQGTTPYGFNFKKGEAIYFRLTAEMAEKLKENGAIIQGSTYTAKAVYLRDTEPDYSGTGITSVGTENTAKNSAVYNLGGQRVADNAKGILIKDGKKIIR